jgi:CheY-like chemotaxis protein
MLGLSSGNTPTLPAASALTISLRQATSWFPDFALIDVILPGMNGINFAILLKEQFPACKVSLFSGQAETNDLLKEANAQGHSLQILAKPVAPAELLSIAAKELQLPLPPAPPPHTD